MAFWFCRWWLSLLGWLLDGTGRNRFFYGTADSGLVMKDHLLISQSSGNPLWSGGTVGPEGSVLVLPLVILIAAGMWIWWGGGSRLRKALLGGAVGCVLLFAGLAGCRSSVNLGEGKPTLELTSSSFRGGEIPKKLACDGVDDSPELA